MHNSLIAFKEVIAESLFPLNQKIKLALHGVYQINQILENRKKKSKSNRVLNFLLKN